MSDAGRVRIGVIGRPHGVRGALKFHGEDKESRTLRKGLTVWLSFADQGPRPVVVASAANGVVTLVDVADRTAAEAYVGAVVSVDRADFVDDDGGVYLVDLVGKAVTDNGVDVGVIVGFTDNGAQHLAELRRADGKTALVPFLPPLLVSVGDVVEMSLPAGLFDLDED